MDHFKGTNETERFNNELLNEIRKTNQLLEQILNKDKTKEDESCAKTLPNQVTLSKGKPQRQSPRQKVTSTLKGKRATSKT